MNSVPSPIFELTAMWPPCFSYDGVGCGQTRPLPPGLVVKYGSNMRERDFRGNAGTVVSNGNSDVCAWSRFVIVICSEVFGSHLNGSTFGHRLLCVEENVVENLTDLAGIRPRQTRDLRDIDRDADRSACAREIGPRPRLILATEVTRRMGEPPLANVSS